MLTITMDEKDAGGPKRDVVIHRDETDFNVFGIRVGEETWSVTVARRFVDDNHALWGWHFTVAHGLVGTGLNAYQWPTWERALEEALTHIKGSTSRRGLSSDTSREHEEDKPSTGT